MREAGDMPDRGAPWLRAELEELDRQAGSAPQPAERRD